MTSPDELVVTTQADVEQCWRTLMEPLGFSQRALWLLLVRRDGRPVTSLMEIGEMPEEAPLEQLAVGLVNLFEQLAGPDGEFPEARVALLCSRPGRRGPTPDDLRIAEAAYLAGRMARVPLEVVHLATDDDVLPVPRDALPRSA